MEQKREARTNLYMPLQEQAEDNHFNNITLPSIQEELPSSPEKREVSPTQSSDSISNIKVDAP